MRGELVLVDTNVFLSATDRSRAGYKAACSLFSRAPGLGVHLCFSGQIIREYLVAATRPVETNGLGLATAEALHNIEEFRRRLVFIEENELDTMELLKLTGSFKLTGKKILDANIVAQMHEHNIQYLVSQNPGDFEGFARIKALDPRAFIEKANEEHNANETE